MSGARDLHAWVDESMVQAAAPDQAVYVLAASVAEPEECEPYRDAMRALLIGRSKRLHWRDEPLPRRLVIAETVAGLAAHHVVVSGAPADPRRQERARRLCLERLLFELHEAGVSTVWLETRTQSLNRRDLTMVAAVRSTGAIPSRLVVDFAVPTDEPMLWLPDAVAGAVGSARCGRDPLPYAALRARLSEYVVGLS